MKDTKAQMTEELRQVRRHLDTILKCPAMTISAQTSPQVSYAGIARTPPTGQPSNVRTLSSMVVFLTKSADARRLLTRASSTPAESQGTPEHLSDGHSRSNATTAKRLATRPSSAKNSQRCARCAKKGHRHDNCREEIIKCVHCGGPHESFITNFPKLYPTRNE
jgi:hypothetical protein